MAVESPKTMFMWFPTHLSGRTIAFDGIYTAFMRGQNIL